MTFKIDGLTYPDIGDDMLRHKTYGPILRSVMRADMQQENYLFLDAVAKGEKYSALFHGFIDAKKAKNMINIASAVRDPMQTAGDMGNFYDKKIWKKGITAARSEINRLVNANITSEILLANTAFRAHHNARMWKNRVNVFKSSKTKSEMKKVKKFLGDTQEPIPMEALNEAYAALKYKPKEVKKAIQGVAKASGKNPREVRSVFKKVLKIS